MSLCAQARVQLPQTDQNTSPVPNIPHSGKRDAQSAVKVVGCCCCEVKTKTTVEIKWRSTIKYMLMDYSIIIDDKVKLTLRSHQL